MLVPCLTPCVILNLIVCPSGVPSNDRCENISASIGLYVRNLGESVNVTAIKVEYEKSLNAAIQNGYLETFLNEINPSSPVYIVTSSSTGGIGNDAVGNPQNNSLSGGAISGIVVGGMAGVILLIGFLSRRQQRRDTEEYYLKENRSADAEEMTSGTRKDENKPTADSPSPDETKVATAAAVGAAAAVTAVATSSRPSKSKDIKKADHTSSATSIDKPDSDAGSSGWSSREGMSSLESSAEDETRASSLGGAASTAASPSQSQTLASSSAPDSDPGLQMTYSELDQAIQQGDWAAVGVTAALLASQSHSSSSQASPEKKVNFQRDLSNTRAAELDRLVEAGDWAGVVAAAAKYDSSETQQGSINSAKSEGRTSESSTGSVGSTGTGPSAHSGSGTALTAGSGALTSAGTTTSDTNSRVKKLDEIRAEVEHLVDKVVPEEKDNIDEMLMQFRGREEELVETLRTMQEREVAQKARVEGQKRAKRDARQKVEQNKQTTPATAVDNTGEPADDNWIREIEDTPADPNQNREAAAEGESVPLVTSGEMAPPQEEDESEDDEKDVKAMQSALKQAIDSEDWEKVAQTAAGLSGRFVDNDADGPMSDASTKDSDNSQEINELVDKGDWDGVVAAASKYTENDPSESTGDSGAEQRRATREKRLKEEHEALQQAEIWNAIAQQTKQDNAPSETEANRAATVAADWAIARSLSELHAAEKASKVEEKDTEDRSDTSGSDGANDDDQEGTI